MAYSYHTNFSLPRLRPPIRRRKPTAASFSDPFVLQIADKLEDSLPSSPPLLQKLRDSSSQSLLSLPWPSPKDEPFRFTELSFLKSSQILPSSNPPKPPPQTLPLSSSSNQITILDGRVVPSLSTLPAGAFAGSASDIPSGALHDTIIAAAGEPFCGGDLFWNLNGFGAPDLAVVYVPDGERMVEEPLHLRICAVEAAEVGSRRLPLSSPRVLVVVGRGAELGIVEEYVGVGGGEGGRYWSNSVAEIVVGEGGRVLHSYVQKQSVNAAHFKWTFVRQV